MPRRTGCAQRYERSEARRDTRVGHYERKLHTKAGEVRLKIPKLRQQTFKTAIIERYRRTKVREIAAGAKKLDHAFGQKAHRYTYCPQAGEIIENISSRFA